MTRTHCTTLDSPADPLEALTAGALNSHPFAATARVAGTSSASVAAAASTAAASAALDTLQADEAACSGLGVSMFFSEDFDDIAAAKTLCLQCPIRSRCLDAAVERGEQYGVWGGQLFEAGRIVISKRRRGRPAKVARPQDRLPEVAVPIEYQRLVTAG